MSYDLQVYAPSAMDIDRIRELITNLSTLFLDEFDGARASYTVTRGVKRSYCFTVEGPVQVEPEDVPEDVTAVLLGATHLFNVSVEGSTSANIPHAVRFARRLAQSLGGVVVDQQLDEVWAKGVARHAAKPARDKRVSIIDLNWYARFKDVAGDFGGRYVALCHRFLPEALPRRFGEYEPFQGKLADAGDDGFAKAWRQASSMLFFAASSPCVSGSMWAGPGELRPRPVWRMSFQVHCQPITDDVRWRDALRRMFVAIAEELPAFYASAEVTRGHIWNGRSMWSDSETEWATMPVDKDGWLGLPPYPTWWAWYADPYRSLVQDRLRAGVTEHDTGLLHELAQSPADRDDLTRAFTLRRGLRRTMEWAPPELVATLLPSDGRVRPAPLGRAKTVPGSLQ